MGVQEAVEASFRELLLAGKPYKKITVAEVCEGAGIARKTFYAHFDEKEGIIGFIFRRDVVDPQYEMHKLLPRSLASENAQVFIEKMYDRVLDDREFYHALVGPLRGVDDTFIRVATWAIYDLNRKLFDEGAYFDAEWETDYAAYFFGSSQAMLMQKWISDGMEVPPSALAAHYCRLTMPFWKGEQA